MKKILGLVALTFFTGTMGVAEEVPPLEPQQPKVIDFYMKNIAGVELKMNAPVSAPLTQGDNTFLITYSRKAKFSNITLTKSGFTFEVESEVNTTSSKLDDAGNPQGAPNVHKRKFVHRYSISERKSSRVNSVIGYFYARKDSDDESTGEVSSVRVKLDDNALHFESNTIMYSDDSLDYGVNIYPGATATNTTFTVVDGKLKLDEDITLFVVNPADFHGVELTDDVGQPMKPAHITAVEQ